MFDSQIGEDLPFSKGRSESGEYKANLYSY